MVGVFHVAQQLQGREFARSKNAQAACFCIGIKGRFRGVCQRIEPGLGCYAAGCVRVFTPIVAGNADPLVQHAVSVVHGGRFETFQRHRGQNNGLFPVAANGLLVPENVEHADLVIVLCAGSSNGRIFGGSFFGDDFRLLCSAVEFDQRIVPSKNGVFCEGVRSCRRVGGACKRLIGGPIGACAGGVCSVKNHP